MRLFLNILAWGVIANATCNNSRNYVPQHSEELTYILHIIAFNLVYCAAVYLNSLVFIPRLLFRKKILLYTTTLLVHIAVCATIMALYSEHLHQLFPDTPQHCFSAFSFGTKGYFTSWAAYIISVGASVAFLLFLFTIGLLAQKFFEVNRQKEAVQKQQTAAELSLLKSQINPHFLFNVLNSIYSLSLKKSDRTPQIVLQLSDLLRYMLYETQQEQVPLEKEIQMIRDYIAIEQERVSTAHQIILKIPDSPQGYSIAPLLLIPFIENAIKHGLDSLIENAFLHIFVQVDHGILHFSCSNNYKEPVLRDTDSGIGLSNVKKRLQLIYPNRHTLVIDRSNHIFSISLNINLNS